MSSLEDVLKEFIARDLGVSPQEVTPEFIRKWRKNSAYSRSRIEFRSHYGGYRGSRLRDLTQEQIESNRKRADVFLKQFAGGATKSVGAT